MTYVGHPVKLVKNNTSLPFTQWVQNFSYMINIHFALLMYFPIKRIYCLKCIKHSWNNHFLIPSCTHDIKILHMFPFIQFVSNVYVHQGTIFKQSIGCSRSFWYICLLGLLASVTDGSWLCVMFNLSMYVQEPLLIGRRGCTGRDLNEETLAADNGC